MKKGQSHPASALSEHLLSRGLLSLLEEKPFRDITVRDLCARSDIARRTFYRHFHTVEDVMAYALSHIMEEFREQMLLTQKETYPSILASYFAFWKGHASLLELLDKNNITYLLFGRYLECISSLPWLFPSRESLPDDRDSFACSLSYHSGGLWSVLTYWIINGCRLPEEMLAGILCSQMPGICQKESAVYQNTGSGNQPAGEGTSM